MWKIWFLSKWFLQNQFLTSFEEVMAKNRFFSFSTFWNFCPSVIIIVELGQSYHHEDHPDQMLGILEGCLKCQYLRLAASTSYKCIHTALTSRWNIILTPQLHTSQTHRLTNSQQNNNLTLPIFTKKEACNLHLDRMAAINWLCCPIVQPKI